MMRQESPSPNSTLSNSALAAAKPPTPTSSPKLRRRTISGGSGDQSIVRQHLDLEVEGELEEKVNVKSKTRSQAGRRDSPSEIYSPSIALGGQSAGSSAAPVVQDKRRSSAGPEHTGAWSEVNSLGINSADSSPSKSHRRKDFTNVSPASPGNRIEGNKCVKRTQSLKEQLVKKFSTFSTVFTPSKTSSSSTSSSPVNNTNGASVSPTSAVENLKSASMATSAQAHAQPVISGSRRSRIPQPTPIAVPGEKAVNGCLEHDIDTYKAELTVNDHNAQLYSPRQFVTDEVRSSDEHMPIAYDGNQMLRIVKDQEVTPFRSHPVDRCGVVVPTGPSSGKSHDPDLDAARQTSPNTTDSKDSKKTPRVIGFEKQDYQKPLPFSRTKMSRNRPGSLRHNVQQVLPNKKLLREKANSNENLTFAPDVPFGETFALNSTPQASSPIPNTTTDRPASTGSAAVNLVPRPPMMKRHSTDSDDNSATESELTRGSGSTVNGAPNAGLPPRSRLGMYPKVKKYPPGSNGSSNGANAPATSGSSSSSAGGHSSRTAPILIGGASKRDCSPSMDGSLLLSARPDDSSDNDSSNEDVEGGGNTSDGDSSPKGSTSGREAGGERTLPASSRQKSNSLEALYAENPTRPKIRQPSARFSRQGAGSPPKTVKWNLVPDVVNYSNDESTPGGGDAESAGNPSSTSSSSSSSRHRHHRHRSEIPFSHHKHHGKMRHAASDERLFEARKGIANSTLIAVHERFLEQMTMLLKEEMQLLEEVKNEKKSMTIYREVMQKILTIKAQNVKQMQDILLQSDV